jgi:hypothetical protein
MANLPSWSDAERVFWHAVWVLLILGFASWALEALPSQPNTGGWIGRFLGFGIWVGVVAACALLLKTVSKVQHLLQALAAMRGPLVVLGAAAYILFFNDQGREFGLSLMRSRYASSSFFLVFALLYWSLNNWHTARLGIHAAIERGIPGGSPSQPSLLPDGNPNRGVVRGDERCWPPRLLGLCPHFFATISLSLAAWGLPIAAWGKSGLLRWLAWTGPLAILLATAFVLAERVKRSSCGISSTSPNRARIARCVAWAAISGEILLLSGLGGVASFLQEVPQGFIVGTITISLSAVLFLWVDSWRDRAPPGFEGSLERAMHDRRQQKEIEVHTLFLFVVACLVALAVWISPVQVPQSMGSMAVACFAFGAILAVTNAFGFTVVWTTRRRWFGETARPHVVRRYAIAFVVGVAVLNAWTHPFHRVRLCDGADCVPPPPDGFLVATVPDERPTVAAAARAWYEQAKAAYAKADGQGAVPMLIVAAAGGGIRSAYWTATILERLEEDLAAEGGMSPYLFGISGVSGGSVGAAAFEAALAQREEAMCRVGDAVCREATEFLTEDFLAPAIASLIFMDTPSSFLPDLGLDDRGAVLERSFEQASRGLLARPFLSFFRLRKDAVANKEPGSSWWRPILLLNATHEETGKRIITGHVLIERGVFLDSFDALHVLGKDVRASTAAHNSARFTYVSPPGDLGNRNGSVIDGGYFENYGALSALELARAAKSALKDERPGVKLFILLITSDPGFDRTSTFVRVNVRDSGACLIIAEREAMLSGKGSILREQRAPWPNYSSSDAEPIQNALFNEFLAPFKGIMNVREAHGNRAVADLTLEICDKAEKVLDDSAPVKAPHQNPYFAHLAMCKNWSNHVLPIEPPLGWVLSESTQKAFAVLLRQCENDVELTQLEIELGKKGATQQQSPDR